MTEVLLIILCYLIGSIPFSYILGRFLGKTDISNRGSGNIGATNVLRTTNVPLALLALAGDALKGVAAAWIGSLVGGQAFMALCCAAAISGHCYSVFLKFKGGKGVATAAGVLAFLMPDILGILAILFVGIVLLTRYVSLASICAALVFPLLAMALHKPWLYVVLSMFMAMLVLYRHRENIAKLKEGRESKINEKAR